MLKKSLMSQCDTEKSVPETFLLNDALMYKK